MRHSLFTGSALSVLIFASLCCAAQDAALDLGFYRKKLLKANLLSPILRTFAVAYENVTSPETSLQVGFFINAAGFGVTPEFRYYLSESKQPPSGFYIAPFLQYQDIEDQDEHVGGGLIVGGQQLYKEKIAIDWYFGPSYHTFTLGELSDFGLRAGVTLGLNLTRKR